jgi:hypothetical protein
LIGFTRGLQYRVVWNSKVVQQIEIPAEAPHEKPTVVSIYPSGDSLPVNLLKMYIEFSQPMREGQASDNIRMVRNGRDTLSSIFLNLEPELWNRDRTILTIWLDPGRIKRGLQPNEQLGPPLEKGNQYDVLIAEHWQDASGVPLVSNFKKHFVAVTRDDKSPDPAAWAVNSPTAFTQEPLQIQLGEPLDYLVLKNAVRIVEEKRGDVSGEITLSRGDSMLRFTPTHPWTIGIYSIHVEARLEDVAGNNLQRLFDRDILKDSIIDMKEYRRIFYVR